MQAIVDIGSKQYKVTKDQILYVELLPQEKGSKLDLKPLCIINNNDIKIGSPFVNDVTITAEILEEVKGDKINGFKYKRRKNYRRSWGHRQRYHKLQITSISA